MRRHNLNLLVMFVFSLSILAPFTGTVFAKNKAEKSFHESVSGKGLDNIEIETTNGSLVVNGYEGDDIIVDAEISVTGRKMEMCQELIEKVHIRLNERGDDLHVDVDFKKKRKYKISVSFDVQLPSRMGLNGNSVNGSIEASNLHGGVDVSTVNGQIICQDISGGIDAGTVNGSIELTDIEGVIDAGTVNGSINCSIGDKAPSRVDFGTVNGNIELDMLSDPNAFVEAAAMNGRIEINGVPGVDISKRIKSWEGELGNGDGHYEFGTVNGSVTINVEKKK